MKDLASWKDLLKRHTTFQTCERYVQEMFFSFRRMLLHRENCASVVFALQLVTKVDWRSQGRIQKPSLFKEHHFHLQKKIHPWSLTWKIGSSAPGILEIFLLFKPINFGASTAVKRLGIYRSPWVQRVDIPSPPMQAAMPQDLQPGESKQTNCRDDPKLEEAMGFHQCTTSEDPWKLTWIPNWW